MVRLLSFILLMLTIHLACWAGTPEVRVMTVAGPINPVTADYLRKNLHESARRQEKLALIEMDTPGGLDTAMRDIVKELLASLPNQHH